MNNEQIKIIAEFVDNASSQVRALMGVMSEFTKGLIEGADAELKAIEANKKLADNAKETNNGMEALESRLKTLAIQFFAVKSVVDAFVGSLKDADRLDDLSDKTGIAAGTLRELEYAAKIGGTSLEGLVGAMDKLGRSADKSEEETSKQAKTFEQLGVSAQNADGSLKSSEQLLTDLADAFSKIKDGPEKSAAAFRLFGAEAKNMLPLLNRGSEGIKALREESRQLSGIDPGKFTEFGKAAGDLFDNMDKVSQVFKGFFVSIGSELVPLFNVLIEQFISSAKEGGLLRDVLNGVTAVVKNVLVPAIQVGATVFDAFTSTIKIAGKSIGALFAIIGAVARGDIDGAKAIISEYGKDVAQVAQEHVDFTKKMAAAGIESAKLAESTDKQTKSITSLGGKVKQTSSELQKYVDQLRIAATTSGVDESAKQMLEAQLKATDDLKKKNISPERAQALLKEADAWIKLSQAVREATDGQKAYESAQADIAKIEEETQLLQFEATLVGKNADERQRLIDKFKEEIELRKVVAGLSDSDAAKVAEQFRKAQEARAEAKKAADNAKVANDLYDQSISGAQELFAKRIQILYKMYEEGKITLQDYTKLQQEEFDKLTNKMKTTADEATVFWQEAAKNMQGAMSSFFFDFMQGKMSNLGQSFKRMIDQMIANALAAKLGDALFGAGFQKNGQLGGLLGSVFSGASNFFGGFRENGGAVQAGKAYVVGEKRPELFVPKVPGMIVPSLDGIGGSSNNLNITVHAFDSKDVLSAMDDISRKGAKMFSRARGKYNF